MRESIGGVTAEGAGRCGFPCRAPAEWATVACGRLDFGGFFRERALWQSPWAIRAYRGLRRLAERAGFQVVLKTFYSPIPELDRLPPGWFERVGELPGLDLGLDRQLALLRQRLAAP